MEFVSAAVKIKNQETNTYVVMYGLRHHEIYQRIREAGFADDFKVWHEDGFLVKNDKGVYEYINREDATELAKEMGIKMISNAVLTSEDLW